MMKTKIYLNLFQALICLLFIFICISTANAQTDKKHKKLVSSKINPDLVCPGSWSINPSKLVSGDTVRLKISYEQGSAALDASASHTISLEAISVKSLFHCRISEDVEVVPYKGILPKVEIEQIEYSGVGYRVMKLTFPNGLKAGESFSLLFGNKDNSGNITAIVNPFPFNLGLPVHTDFGDGIEHDWVDQGWFDNIPKCEIVSAEPSAIRLFAPTLVQTNENFELKLSVTDAFDCRPEPFYEGQISIEKDNDIENLPISVKMNNADSCHLIIDNLKINKEGIYRIKVKLQGNDKFFESNPIVVRSKVEEPIYWGNIHNHGPYSECFGESMNWFYEFARDISGMDFVAMSDHIGVKPDTTFTSYAGRLYKWRTGVPITSHEAWSNTIDAGNHYNNETNFVTLIGYEWSSMDAGHNNIYMADATIDNMEKIFTTKQTDYSVTMRQLLQKHDVLFMPHIHAGIYPWRTLEERAINGKGRLLTPAVEVYSDWGAAVEPYAGINEPMNKFGGLRNPIAKGALWAWEQGYKFGTIADADAHTGLPGRRVVGGIAPHHDHPAGLTAVKTNNFSRRGVMNAYHDMKTYGTTGERIFLEVQANNKIMGETMETDNSFNLDVIVAGTDAIDNIKLFRGLELLEEFEGDGQKDVTYSFACDAPTTKEQAYIIQLTQKDGNMAWSTPIWIRKKSVPELNWEITVNSIILKNSGNATAQNVEVWFDKKEYPFTSSSILGDEPTGLEEYGFVFSDVRDNQNVILHYRWHGEPLKGTMSLHGIDEVDFDYNREFLFNKSYLNKTGDNTYDFLVNKHRLPFTGVGFDIIAKVNPNEASFLQFDFDKNVSSSVNNQIKDGDSLIISLNGRKGKTKMELLMIEELKPGKSKSFPLKKGYWSVDPNNRILEKDENNNLKMVL